MTQTVQRVSCPRLTLVVPCHNEEQVLPETASRIVMLFDELTREALVAEPSQSIAITFEEQRRSPVGNPSGNVFLF